MKIYITNQESIDKGIWYKDLLMIYSERNKHYGWGWNEENKPYKVMIIKDNCIKDFI